ncbi:exonuclease SbcCD subunit D [Trueperella bialowiezensis]|uniref:Nuclease SbcCD subunit D n=1 Tax=Trueperella bialowiezensis TaxID=312285 RepID=A0A3S4YYQ8_9ACTO|nr:exonuclease SbcCD subunit D [Trueperella bialowiezensis]VEI13722.1 Nuclease sbcCD subunit D [Trueperella bialowiezensis]
MRFLHTSDWHLGRRLHGADLTPAFEAWTDHVVELVATQDIDALLISGDVYDRGIPPVDMVELLSDTLARACEHTRVIIISGNHDSPQRLGFGANLMRPGLHFYTDSRRAHIPVVIPDSEGNPGAYVYPIPYLDPDAERARLADDPAEPLERSHTAVVGKVLDNIRTDLAARTNGGGQKRPYGIVMAHAFVVGAEESDSERDITVGGAGQIPASLFDIPGIDYVALGHLHGPQRVGGPNRADGQPLIRYSGSPIAFSFSEQNHRKSSVIVDTQAKDPIELIPAPVYRKLATITGTLEELLSDKFADYRDHFLRVIVTDPDRPADLFAKLTRHFPHVLEHQHLTDSTAVSLAELEAIRSEPLAVLREFFETSGGRKLTEVELSLIADTWDAVRQAHAVS